MHMKSWGLTALTLVLIPSVATAHEGRRMDIQVINNQLFTQGFIGGGTDDGGGNPRPYYNAIHDHWSNAGSSSAFSTLPGFAVLDPANLLGYDVVLELTGAKRWDNPAPGPGVIPDLVDLTGETIDISFNGTSVDTNNLGGQLMIVDDLAGAESDIDLTYVIDISPSNRVYALQWQLTTNKPGVAPSEPVWTLFAPDPSVGGIHHAALHLENYLAVSVPEPTGAGLLAAVSAMALLRRRRSATAVPTS